MSLESQQGTARSIWIAPNKGEPMERLDCALADRDGGLRDPSDPDRYDRYHAAVRLGAFSHQGGGTTRDVSLLATEALDFARALRPDDEEQAPVEMFDTRRNIEIAGFGPDLTILMHRRIVLSSGAELYVMGPCAPCERPNKLAQRKGRSMASFKENFGKGGGGVRARVVTTGLIAVGNTIVIVS